MSSIVCIQIAHRLRSPYSNIDQAAKRYNSFFSITSASKLAYCPNDLLSIDSFSRGVVIPPENPDVCAVLPLDFEETSLLIPIHAFFSFALNY
jgi:hypothetical protein